MFAGDMVKSLETRLPDYRMIPLCIHATFLHPRLKDVCFETGTQKNYVRALLQTDVEKESLETFDPADKAITQTCATFRGRSTTSELFKELETRKEASLIEMSTTEKFADYLGSLFLLRGDSTLAWWRAVGETGTQDCVKQPKNTCQYPQPKSPMEDYFLHASMQLQIVV